MPERTEDRAARTPEELYGRGLSRLHRFCRANRVPPPRVEAVPATDWHVNACAYYRPQTIRICLRYCGRPCGGEAGRNWTWPGSTTDREPYGVLCHELGHHCDWLAGGRKGRYFSDYGEGVVRESGEPPISGYCPNPAEWFAEMFRLYVANHALLYALRPRTWGLLRKRWVPVSGDDWLAEMGPGVPARVVRALRNKGAR
jgi:hypothetical protein